MALRTPVLLTALLASTLALSACESVELAYGDVNSIIVGADPELWSQVEDSVRSTLRPSITTTVRQEEIFQVTYRNPADTVWSNLRKFKQVLLLGTPEDPWIQRALDKAGIESPEPPMRFQANDVWARNQLVTVLVLPDQGAADAVHDQLPGLAEQYLEQYRQWAVSRMFVSGRDSALADTLGAEASFRLLLPEVYQWWEEDGVYFFRNDNPDPAELIRQIAVTWKSPIPEEGMLQQSDLVTWRRQFARQRYDPPQLTTLTLAAGGRIGYRGHDAYQLQATWTNPPEADWPAAGPFILRAIECEDQDRLYLIDAWLYAPGKDKFEYMVQLETILGSFRCGSGG